MHEDIEKLDEGTVEATVVVPEEPNEPGGGAGNNGGIQADNGIEEADEPAAKPGKPEHAQGGKKQASRNPGKLPVRGRPDDVGKAGEKPAGGNPGKVTLCHKDRVTISVGAPAEPAHLRHGDRLGAC